MENVSVKQDVKWELLIWSVALGFLFEWFFVGHAIGISYPLFVVVFYGVFFWFLRERLKFDDSWFFFVVTVALAATFGIFANDDLARINFYLVPGLIIGHTLMVSNIRHYCWSGLGFIGDVVRFVFDPMITNLKKPFEVIGEGFTKKLNKEKWDVVKKVITGVLLAMPLLFIVVVLLSSADLAFRELFDKLPDLFTLDNPDKLFRSTFAVVSVAIVSFSFIWSHLATKLPKKEDVDDLVKPWDPIVANTVLVLVNVVYLIFVAIQFSYLFGGQEGQLIEGYTYAQYARRGFFELLFVGFVNFLLLVGMLAKVNKGSKRMLSFTKAMKTLLVLATFVIIYSSHFRLSLYESVFGFTRLRVYSHFFVVLLALLFVVGLRKIWVAKSRLWKAMVVIFLAWYTVLNYMNVDALIVRKNIERYQETEKIDLSYFRRLSADAYPEIMKLKAMLPGSEEKWKLINMMKDTKFYASGAGDSWQSYNWSVAKMKELQVKN